MKKPVKNLFAGFDYIIVSLTLICSIFGIIIISSAVRSFDNSLKFILIQSLSLIIGVFLMVCVASFDYNKLTNSSKIIYSACFAVLLVVLFIGSGDEIGSKSWIRFGSFGIQPSEYVKIGMIISLSRIFSKTENINEPKSLLLVIIHILPIVALILMQPDFGTTMVFIVIVIGMLFVAGISYKYILSAIGIIGVSLPIIWQFLQDYQKNRILVFFNPESDPLGAGYHVIQSKIAIGSGEIFGKGLYHGTQTQLDFLPAKHTDFVFAVIGEELGLIGCIIAIALLISIVIRCIYISNIAKNSEGSYICVGIAFMMMGHIFENIGMCVGLMPVTGIPLPFFSYGGSSLIANFIAIGLVINVYKQRRRIIY
ncbi:MAG: rod shape-determining protein RodA [Ruminococcaceae bacterium]|nr:rod shape-determining protein RodA [Oscillospiraceae bacterium]